MQLVCIKAGLGWGHVGTAIGRRGVVSAKFEGA